MNDEEIFNQLVDLQQNGIASCLATIIRTAGSTPREIGAKMLICLDGTTYGSIGGGCGERQLQSAAIRCLLKDKKPEILDIDLTVDLNVKGGDVCGGNLSVFVEPFF
jgi:xanthine dehydrogenase accessory factor|tara:strand:- start:164 stop:484 length:321 start_codon:yes stop_codon:yes gene_type:complete